MESIFKDYLFNHGILVCEEKDKLEIAFASRFLLATEFGINVKSGKELITKDMIPYVATKLGKNVPEPFYKGFPDSIRQLTSEQLLVDQALHYLKTYGLGDFSEQGHSVMEECIKRTAFNEKVKMKEFEAYTTYQALKKLEEYVEDMLSGTRPLSVEQYYFLYMFILEYSYEIKNCSSKNLAIKLLLDFRDTRYATFLDMSDVIKLVEELNYHEYKNTNIKKLSLKNKDRKFISNIINQLFVLGNCDVRTCYEKKALWCGLLHHIHYKPFDETSAHFVKCMRGYGNFSVYAEFEDAMTRGDICAAVNALKTGKGNGTLLRNVNYILSRCENQEQVDDVFKQMEATNGLVLLQLLMKYSFFSKKENNRYFKFTKHNKLVVHEETPLEKQKRKSYVSKEIAQRLCKKIKDNLKTYYQDKLGKVFIDADMEKIALPLQETTTASGYGVLAKGSRLPVEKNKKIRAFTYWEKVNDIDLSMIGICEDGTQIEFSWRTMWERQSNAITFSGDETSGYEGGSEYFDIDVEKVKNEYPDVEYLVFCNNVFSHDTFNHCICKAGYMLRDKLDSGEVFEPKTVKSSFTINCESRFAYLFAIDLMTSEFVWLNVSKDSDENIAGRTSFDFLKEYLDATSVMNMKQLFSMLASEIVDTEEEADVIVSDKSVTTDNKEIIRSYDFEKIIALMN